MSSKALSLRFCRSGEATRGVPTKTCFTASPKLVGNFSIEAQESAPGGNGVRRPYSDG